MKNPKKIATEIILHQSIDDGAEMIQHYSNRYNRRFMFVICFTMLFLTTLCIAPTYLWQQEARRHEHTCDTLNATRDTLNYFRSELFKTINRATDGTNN
jgi:hypothetical protein